MLKWLSQRWLGVYALAGAVFFLLFIKEPADQKVSALNYARRSEQAIVDRIYQDQKPTSYELTWGVEYYKDFIDFLGPSDSAYGNLGYCYYYLGQPQKALEMYDKAITLSARPYWYYWDQGMIYAERKEYDKAMDSLQKAMDFMPSTIQQYIDLAKQEEFRRMISEQRIAQDLSLLLERAKQDRVAVLVKMAEIFLSIGRNDIAEAMTDHALASMEFKKENIDVQALRGSFEAKYALMQKNKKELRLHFDSTCFFYFFTTLTVGEKLTPVRP